jgi:hypothetical protein
LGVAALLLGTALSVPSASAAPAPTIEMSPACAGGNVTLTVTARGLDGVRGRLLIKSRRPNGDTGYGYFGHIVSGTATGTIGLQLGRSPGAWISIYQYIDGPGQDLATAWYPVGCARLAAAPRRLGERPGPQQFGYAISGFQGQVPVELSLPGIAPVSVQPNADGVAQGTVTFARQPACGPSTLTARQQTHDPDQPTPEGPDLEFAPAAAAFPAGVDRVVSVSLMVHCPRLTVGPASLPDSALPGTGTAAGTGWVPARPVGLTVDGRPLDPVTPGEAGQFRGPLRLPRLGCGPHRIEARQVVDLGADKPLPRPAPLILASAASITVTCTAAVLTVDPTVTPAGMVTTATGAGFVAGRTVRLEWTALDGRLLGEAATTTGTTGSFVTTCLVLPNTELGTRRLRAVELPAAGDPVGARVGQADVLIVPSTMERGRERFLQRG